PSLARLPYTTLFRSPERLDGLAHVEPHGLGEPRSAEVVHRLALVLRIAVGEVQLAVRADRAREPVPRVPVPGSQLERPPRADRRSEEHTSELQSLTH